MTYVAQNRRDAIQPFITAIVNKAKQVGAKRNDMSFLLSEIALGVFRPDTGWTYDTLSTAIDVLRRPADEITRRGLGSFAEAAVQIHGDNPNMAQLSLDIQSMFDGILPPA